MPLCSTIMTLFQGASRNHGGPVDQPVVEQVQHPGADAPGLDEAAEHQVRLHAPFAAAAARTSKAGGGRRTGGTAERRRRSRGETRVYERDAGEVGGGRVGKG